MAVRVEWPPSPERLPRKSPLDALRPRRSEHLFRSMAGSLAALKLSSPAPTQLRCMENLGRLGRVTGRLIFRRFRRRTPLARIQLTYWHRTGTTSKIVLYRLAFLC